MHPQGKGNSYRNLEYIFLLEDLHWSSCFVCLASNALVTPSHTHTPTTHSHHKPRVFTCSQLAKLNLPISLQFPLSSFCCYSFGYLRSLVSVYNQTPAPHLLVHTSELPPSHSIAPIAIFVLSHSRPPRRP